MMADLEFWKGGFQYVIKVHVALLGGVWPRKVLDF